MTTPEITPGTWRRKKTHEAAAPHAEVYVIGSTHGGNVAYQTPTTARGCWTADVYIMSPARLLANYDPYVVETEVILAIPRRPGHYPWVSTDLTWRPRLDSDTIAFRFTLYANGDHEVTPL